MDNAAERHRLGEIEQLMIAVRMQFGQEQIEDDKYLLKVAMESLGMVVKHQLVRIDGMGESSPKRLAPTAPERQ